MRLLIISISIALAGCFMLTDNLNAQERGGEDPRVSPDAAVSQTIGLTEVSVTYGRPGVNNRDIFALDGLVPFDEVWRTGANEATTITFSDDVRVEGEVLDAGIYGLFTIPGEDNWTIIFNRIANQWGAYDYEESEDVLRVEVNPEESHYMDQMMIYFEEVTESSGDLVIHWDHTRVPVTIEPVAN